MISILAASGLLAIFWKLLCLPISLRNSFKQLGSHFSWSYWILHVANYQTLIMNFMSLNTCYYNPYVYLLRIFGLLQNAMEYKGWWMSSRSRWWLVGGAAGVLPLLLVFLVPWLKVGRGGGELRKKMDIFLILNFDIKNLFVRFYSKRNRVSEWNKLF